jgi:hypothetical protein
MWIKNSAGSGATLPGVTSVTGLGPRLNNKIRAELHFFFRGAAAPNSSP